MIQLRGLIVHHHIVIDGDDVHLFDSGFLGGLSRIRKALAERGMDLSHIRSLILTHGHLDHTLNAAGIQNLTACKVYAPRLDQAHVEGRHRYRGWSRICGFLEFIGRHVLRFTPPSVDEWFEDGDVICGFQVVALPGHTAGHCGFYDESQQRLIASDLFSNHLGSPMPPPRILNDDHTEALRSILKAAGLKPKEVFLNHSTSTPAVRLAVSLQALALALSAKKQSINHAPNER